MISKKYKLLYILSALSLTACGGGGGGGSSATPDTPTIAANAKLMTDVSRPYMSDKEAILEMSIEVGSINQMLLQAADNKNELEIYSREFVSTSSSSHAIHFEEISSDQSCLSKKILQPAENCIDQWKVSTVNQEDQYQGKVVYGTNLGSIEAPVQIVFKSPTDPVFQRDRFTISSITPIAVGETTSITLNNSTQYPINYPVIEFPKGLKPFITDMSTVTEIKSGQSAIIRFKIIDSKEAQQALKAGQDDLNANKEDAHLKYSSARFSTQVYQLQPTIYLNDLVIQKSNAQNFREIDGKLAMDLSILNVSQDSMTNLIIDITKGSQYITVDHSKCHFPLQKNNSCIVTIMVDPSISSTYASDSVFDINLKVNDQSNREPGLISFLLDMNANVAIGLESTLVADHENQIYLQNNSLIQWLPSSDVEDYKIIDGMMNDITSEFVIGNGVKSPDCLTAHTIAKNTGCYITVLPNTDQTGKQLKLHLDHSNVQNAALLLPSYSANGISGNNALTPATVIKGRDLSMYFTIAPPSSKTFKGFEVVGLSTATQDMSYPNSCKQGDIVNSDHPCQLKIDIAGDEIDGENFKPQLIILWQDGTQSTAELNIDIVDPTQPGEDVSGLSDINLLQSQTNYVDINQDGIQIFIKNTTGKVLSALNIQMLPQWLNDLVDVSQLQMITLSPDQEAMLNIPLKSDKSANDLSAALRAHLDEITHNDHQDETGGQVIRFSSSNALDDYFPKIKVDTIPYFDSEGFNDENNKQTLTYTMVFGKPNQQYIEVKNPTNYRYDINFSESLPSGITRVMSGAINGLTNCSEFPSLLAGEKCAVALIASPNANVIEGDHLDLSMTPAEGDVTSTTTLQMSFKVNYVYDITYQAEGSAIAIPLSGHKVYNLKLVNNEQGIQWVPSTNISDYMISHDQGVSGLSITAPTIMPNCTDGSAVATDGYCYIGLEIDEHALTQSNYQLSLKMGESNLALDVLNVGQISIVEYGKASVQLVQNGHSINHVVRAGEIIDVVISAPENWYASVADDQQYSIRANHPAISFPQGSMCILSQSAQSTECKVPVQIDEALQSGHYLLKIIPEQQTILPINLSELDLGVSSVKYTSISSFNNHVCALDDKDNAYCWGRNFNGQLGSGESYEYALEPVSVVLGDASAGNQWQNIAVGFYHTCALNQLGDAYCWGSNYKGELGNGSFQESNTPKALANGEIPQGVKLTEMQSGASFSCALATDKHVYCWGNNQNGVLGAGITNPNKTVPVRVNESNITPGALIESISLGNNHACLLTDTKEAYCWGSNYYKELGTQLPVNTSNTPIKVNLEGVSLKSIYTGHSHTCGVSDHNETYCWGNNDSGQLGTGVPPSLGEALPKKVESGSMPEGVYIESMALGSAHSCAIASDDKVYCWGANSNGLLGNGVETGNYENKPIAIVQGDIPEGALMSSIVAGSSHTCVLSMGYSYCWGRNTNGQLGNGTLNNSLIPAVGKLPIV
ncbi:hypothetical protein [Cysteiniphilum sp. QT6929]|uniref:RCC1 domain-containing protein n=1 Tax=Cysteiniphilum sp. QT6929 TaxID=2975055 RepID=UPI0024B37270|nr:hypothetical protein [Cysteiniphilum sp. QT6929]WHN65771.1 hypothetical protein NYP54_00700 [Cysteiniphilum sp. QT6929]